MQRKNPSPAWPGRTWTCPHLRRPPAVPALPTPGGGWRRACPPGGGRKLYYFSAEFLVGRLLSNQLWAWGWRSRKAHLAALGRDLALVESREPEPSLGNGGLGRLAACFLDSIAALGLRGDGVGLNYHYGLFRQRLPVPADGGARPLAPAVTAGSSRRGGLSPSRWGTPR